MESKNCKMVQDMLFLKLFHLLALFLWLGSLLSLIRLLIEGKTPLTSLRKLYLSVDLPALIAALGFGIALLVLKGADPKAGWFHMKMTFTLVLVGCDLYTARSLFKPSKSSLYFKILYAVTLLALALLLFNVTVIKNNYVRGKKESVSL